MFTVNCKSTAYGEIIDEPAWNRLRTLTLEFKQRANDKAYMLNLYVAFYHYLCWLSCYCKDRLHGRRCSTDDIIDKVFITSCANDNQYRQYVKFSLFPLLGYVEHLKHHFSLLTLVNYETLIINLYVDAEWLVVEYERLFNGKKNLRTGSGSRKTLSPVEIMRSASELFNIEDMPDVRSISVFDIKPNVVFMLRQLLEMLGKNLIGYSSIVDTTGKPVHQFTQVSWTFLRAMEGCKTKKWSVELPLRVSSIAQLNGWTNSFVHTTYFNQCYLQYYALHCMQVLMKSKQQSTIFYQYSSSINFGDFRIEGYHYLQRDFSDYVKKQKKGNAFVKWMPLRNVGGYIKTFGSPHISLVMHMPPPVHGASMMGEIIHNSALINRNISASYVNIATACSIEDIGKFSLKKLGSFVKLLHAIYKDIRENKPELVYFTPNAGGNAFLKDFIIREELRLLGCNVIAHYHNKGVSNYQGNRLFNRLYKSFFKDTKVILLSPILYDDMKKYVKRADVYICANGIESTHVNKVPIRKNTAPQILFLSNLLPAKGVYVLLDAMAMLKERNVLCGCTFAGAESKEIDAATFNKAVKVRDLQDRVQYLGKKYGKDKTYLYDSSDIFVFPTYEECFGLVLLEAMDASLPCISTREGAIPDIIQDGKTGLLVEKKNAVDLADKMETLVKDENLRVSMGKEGKKRFDQYFTKQIFENNLFDILAQASAN